MKTRSPCPTDRLLQTLSGPWTTHILWVLQQEEPQRFGVLRRKIAGISSRLLTQRLRLLAQGGFVYRHYEASIPPAVSYGLTGRGRELGEVLKGLDALAQAWQMTEPPVTAHPPSLSTYPEP